jgi:hypothetical protein
LTGLYQQLSEFCFRSQGIWSAKNKRIPRKLAELDPLLTHRFVEAFDAAFSHRTSSLALQLAEMILTPYGDFCLKITDRMRLGPSKETPAFRS